jgi:hypothetical protein
MTTSNNQKTTAAVQLASLLAQLEDPKTASAVLKNLKFNIEIVEAARTCLSAKTGTSSMVARLDAFLLKDAFNTAQASKKSSRQASPSQEV